VTLRDELDLCAPQLYRFACALVAGQAGDCAQAGDLVRTILSSPLRGPIASRLTGDNLRIRLYSTLIEWHRYGLRRGGAGIKTHAELNKLQFAKGNIGGSATINASPRDNFAAALLALGLEEREALLLVSMEGFTYAQAGRILKISRSVLVGRLARARAALSEIVGLENFARSAKTRPSYLRLVK
jgi:RNA polymerase sigma-70 factor, ECF subfamily